jgi:hypothetical protein
MDVKKILGGLAAQATSQHDVTSQNPQDLLETGIHKPSDA